jgi:hypothetical protein
MNASAAAAEYLADRHGNAPEFTQFERITHRHDGHCPVRAHASRLRAQMRSKGRTRRGVGHTINGSHRRRLHRA